MTPMTDPTAPLHVVLGAGQIGPLVVERLRARGLRVRIVRRGAFSGATPGVEQVSADVSDPAQAADAMRGAAVVYHCVNPLYTEWAAELLPMTRGIVAGAAQVGARLVVLDNLYMYGDTRHITDGSPVAPRSRKGALRVEAAEEMLAADRRGEVRVAIGRAADFIGPGAHLAAIFGERFWPRALAGRSVQCFGDPDQLHSYSYTPDVAAGLVALGLRDDASGVWMLPVNPAETTRAVIERIGRALGRDLRITRIPTWLLRALGIASPILREVAEMTYQWRQPYVVDDARFRATFGLAATPWDDAIAATVAWARARYAPPVAAAAAA